MNALFFRIGVSERRTLRFALLEQFGHRDPVEEKIQVDQKRSTEQAPKNQLEEKAKVDQQTQKQTADLTSERLNASIQNAVQMRVKSAQNGVDAHVKQIQEVDKRIDELNRSNKRAAALGDDAALLAQGPLAAVTPNERTRVRSLDPRTSVPSPTTEVSAASAPAEAQAKQKGALDARSAVASVDAGNKTQVEEQQKRTEEVAAKTAGGNGQLERADGRAEGNA